MRGAVAVAAILFVPACSGGAPKGQAGDPVRRAGFRSLAARDFLFTCSGGPGRAETRRQVERMGELYRFAYEKGAGQSLWLAENEWAGLAARDTRAPCAPGEDSYRAALASFSAALDDLAGGIREVRQ
jgi:hypothetical protein